MDGVTTISALVDLLASGLTVDWSGAKLRITATAFLPRTTTELADVPVPTFTGYADKSVAYGAVGFDGVDGLAECSGTATYTWTGPADLTGQTMLGWALIQPGVVGPPAIDAGVLASGLFLEPVALDVPTDILTLTVTVRGNGKVTVTRLS